MKAKQIILTLLIVIGFNLSSQAQIWKKLQKKAEAKIEREAKKRAQRRVDKKIDDVFDKAEEKIDKVGKGNKKNKKESDGNTSAMGDIMNSILNGEEVKTKTSYSFSITATMQVTDHTKRNGETMQMKQSYGKDGLMSELENPKNIIITDLDNKAAIILDPSKKTAQVMSLSWMEKMMKQEPIEENNTAQMTKTGAVKTINGYTCYKYIITDKDLKVDAWFAPDVNFDYNDYLSGMNKMFGNKKSNAISLLNKGQGYVMEMIMYNKGEKQTEMKITELSEKPTTINMSDYTIQKMF